MFSGISYGRDDCDAALKILKSLAQNKNWALEQLERIAEERKKLEDAHNEAVRSIAEMNSFKEAIEKERVALLDYKSEADEAWKKANARAEEVAAEARQMETRLNDLIMRERNIESSRSLLIVKESQLERRAEELKRQAEELQNERLIQESNFAQAQKDIDAKWAVLAEREKLLSARLAQLRALSEV